jgi:adenosylhomocysteine nucleosidase
VDKVAIVAALPREVAFLVKGAGWRRTKLQSCWRVFASERALVVCAGMGAAPARAAAEAVVASAQPGLLISAGLAGGLAPGWRVGQVMIPASILGAISQKRVSWNWAGELENSAVGGVLFSGSQVAGAEQKRSLARQYGADAIDMEAEAVAEVAAHARIPFFAVKAICDEWDFPVPDMAPYIDRQGRFRTSRFVLHSALRPGRWPVIVNLAARSRRASEELGRKLRELLETGALDAVCRRNTNPGLAEIRPME